MKEDKTSQLKEARRGGKEGKGRKGDKMLRKEAELLPEGIRREEGGKGVKGEKEGGRKEVEEKKRKEWNEKGEKLKEKSKKGGKDGEKRKKRG